MLETNVPPAAPEGQSAQKKLVKCVVWDLDNTLWQGVLLEDPAVQLNEQAVAVIKTLDERGILQSIASKNDHERVAEQLAALGLTEYFLYPQVSWNSKVGSIKRIAEQINIGLDTIAFIDDQPFEREEVAFSLPEVRCLDVIELDTLLERPEFLPRFVTSDSRQRRQMYLADIARKQAEERFVGPEVAFLATLQMQLVVAPVREEDLQRAEELTVRTNQLNTTGYTYSYEELDAFRQSPDHTLLVAALTDKYGSYGKIGLVLIEHQADRWTIKLLLMSCRVMSRGVGTIIINHILQLAKNAGVRLQAEFVGNQRNRMMYIAYKFAGFKEVEQRDGVTIFENDLTQIQSFPEYMQVQILP